MVNAYFLFRHMFKFSADNVFFKLHFSARCSLNSISDDSINDARVLIVVCDSNFQLSNKVEED